MDIPDGILNKLTCDSCKNYLSCGPVYLNYKTNKVMCGRCIPKPPKKLSVMVVRYKHYETLASVILFPCKYVKQGCTHKVLFSCKSPQKHESTCPYRKRPCPILSSKVEPHFKCPWIGCFMTLLQHCKVSHPDKVMANPCVIEQVFDELLHDTYLISCFDTLFLLTITITMSDGVVYNCRHIAPKQVNPIYKFILIITNKTSSRQLIRDGVVLTEDVESDRKCAVSVSELIQVFKTTSALFKFMIEERIEKLPEIKMTVNNIYCQNNKHGCAFNDVPPKCKKHETYFCKYLSECPECGQNLGRNLPQHFIKEHGALRYKTGNTWHISEGYKQYCILIDSRNDDVFYFCAFSLACYRLLFSVYTPFTSEQVQDCTCEIRINDPGHCYKHRLVPGFENSACYDWNVNINMYNYPMWRHYGLDLCVVIGKKR